MKINLSITFLIIGIFLVSGIFLIGGCSKGNSIKDIIVGGEWRSISMELNGKTFEIEREDIITFYEDNTYITTIKIRGIEGIWQGKYRLSGSKILFYDTNVIDGVGIADDREEEIKIDNGRLILTEDKSNQKPPYNYTFVRVFERVNK